MTITEFIEARLAEIEARAKAAAEYPGKDWVNHPGRDATESVVFEDAGSPFAWIDSTGSAAIGEHFALHDPRRELREVEAKRKILNEHKAVIRLAGLTEQELGFLGWYREWVLKNLAAIDSDHPDYDPSWAPNPASA